MADSATRSNLLNAAKQLIDSEIQLINIIESSTMNSEKQTAKDRMSPANQKPNRKNPVRKANVKPSAALVAAKEASKKLQANNNKKSHSNYIQDIYQKTLDSYKMQRISTGLVFDRSMTEHCCLWDPNYPECPARFSRVLERCEEMGLIERCEIIKARQAEEEELLMKHTKEQIDILKATDGSADREQLEELSSKYDAVYIHPSTYKLSLLSCGSTINLIESVCKGEVQNGMAIVRPPGHHAMKSEYCGYCFFNNVGIAAEKMLRQGLAQKILIVDWDVHHGQATQQMFYNDPRVVYFSIHRYENGEFWPNLRESDYHYIGEDAGEGYNFNIPLNKMGMKNADYLAIFQQVLLPMAYEFQPDLVIVSAGYDAALGCPEGQMEITPAFYAHLCSSLMSLAGGKVAVVLEGGYCLKSLAEGAALTLRSLLGDPCPFIANLDPPSESIRDTILNVIYSHKKFWNCYNYQDTYSIHTTTNNNDELKNRHMPVAIYKGDETKPKFYETRNCYPVQCTKEVEDIERRLNSLILSTKLTTPTHKVCIVYDERMLKHRDVSDNSHPEKPNRIQSIYEKHKESKLLSRCHSLQGRMATEEELLLAHSKDYVNTIKQTADAKQKDLNKQASALNSIYLHTETWTSACVSVGSLLQVVDSVLNNESQSGVAIVRPPGHHASQDTACGFCIFNNVAIAAKYATEVHNVNRVLIVDWDVHHGNGTQAILEKDPKVLYVSIHRYDNGGFFPNSKKGNYNNVGSGPGEGFTVNIPWNKKGMGDAEYLAAFQQVVMPIAYQYNPELILVSAGFDACIGDPLGGCKVSPETYGHLTHWLSSLANGRVILTLEGGYNVNSISHAMTTCTKALLGDPLPRMELMGQSPCSSAINSINNVLKTHKAYWPNLIFQMSLPKEQVLEKPRSYTTAKVDHREAIAEPKIALEGIVNEKLTCNLPIDKSDLTTVTDEEIAKLQAEVENLKIQSNNSPKRLDLSNSDKERTKGCINEKNSSGASGGGSRSDDGASASGSSMGEAGQGNRGNLVDYLNENLQALVDGEMFAVIPLRDCPHLSSVNAVPASGIDVKSPCENCSSTEENWICLECYTVHCARNINAHAVSHERDSTHPLTLSFTDLSVWCYRCEAYIDNPILFAAKSAVYRSKFNQELPWTYSDSHPDAHPPMAS